MAIVATAFRLCVLVLGAVVQAAFGALFLHVHASHHPQPCARSLHQFCLVAGVVLLAFAATTVLFVCTCARMTETFRLLFALCAIATSAAWVWGGWLVVVATSGGHEAGCDAFLVRAAVAFFVLPVVQGVLFALARCVRSLFARWLDPSPLAFADANVSDL